MLKVQTILNFRVQSRISAGNKGLHTLLLAEVFDRSLESGPFTWKLAHLYLGGFANGPQVLVHGGAGQGGWADPLLVESRLLQSQTEPAFPVDKKREGADSSLFIFLCQA